MWTKNTCIYVRPQPFGTAIPFRCIAGYNALFSTLYGTKCKQFNYPTAVSTTNRNVRVSIKGDPSIIQQCSCLRMKHIIRGTPILRNTHTYIYIYIVIYVYKYNARILSPSWLAKLQYHMGFIVFTPFLPVRDPGEELRIVFTVVSLTIRPQSRWFGSSLHSQSSIYFDDLCGAKKNMFFFCITLRPTRDLKGKTT